MYPHAMPVELRCARSARAVGEPRGGRPEPRRPREHTGFSPTIRVWVARWTRSHVN